MKTSTSASSGVGDVPSSLEDTTFGALDKAAAATSRAPAVARSGARTSRAMTDAAGDLARACSRSETGGNSVAVSSPTPCGAATAAVRRNGSRHARNRLRSSVRTLDRSGRNERHGTGGRRGFSRLKARKFRISNRTLRSQAKVSSLSRHRATLPSPRKYTRSDANGIKMFQTLTQNAHSALSMSRRLGGKGRSVDPRYRCSAGRQWASECHVCGDAGRTAEAGSLRKRRGTRSSGSSSRPPSASSRSPSIPRAPISAGNSLAYVDGGHYDGATIYRAARKSAPGMIGIVQGGLLAAAMSGDSVYLDRSSSPFPPVGHETTQTTGIPNERGTLALARLEPGTASSEFFFNLSDNPELDSGAGVPGRDGFGYATFGRVLRGIGVLDSIQELPADGETAIKRVQGQILRDPVKIRRAYRIR